MNNDTTLQATERGNCDNPHLGRPSKYTPETVKKLLASLREGLNQKQAALASGIGERTLYDWTKEYPELEEAMGEARELARQKALSAIKAAGERDWKAHEAWLRLSFQTDYRQPNTKVEVKTAPQARDIQVLYTEEQRLAMIEARDRFLKERPKSSPLPDQPKLQPGNIGATSVPDDEKETQQPAIVQPGQTFSPYFDPHGIDQRALAAEMYGWHLVEEKRQ